LHQQDELPRVLARQALQLIDGGGQPLHPVVAAAAQDQARGAVSLRAVERRAQRQRSLAHYCDSNSSVTAAAAAIVSDGVTGVVEVRDLESEAAAVHARRERLEVREEVVVGDVAALGLFDQAADVAQQPLQPPAGGSYQAGMTVPVQGSRSRGNNDLPGELHASRVELTSKWLGSEQLKLV
jgi:hypothetical protein